MAKQRTNTPFSGRYIFLCALLIAVVCMIIWRMVDLTVVDQRFLQRQGNARSLRTVLLPAFRGMVTDRHGAPLAVSTEVSAVWANPQTLHLKLKQRRLLSRFIGLSEKQIAAKLYAARHRSFVYLKRGLVPMLSDKVRALNITGLGLLPEYKRYYPEASSTAHLLGFTNIDDCGQEGLELAFDDWLKGEPGKKQVVKDRLGRIMSEVALIKKPRPGRDLQLSIDRHIQFIAYGALKKTVRRFKARSGSVVVLDARNGEVLAMVNYPSFNPNQRRKKVTSSYRNRAVTDTFEPGSVMKAFSVASALDSGKYTSESLIDTSPSYLMVDGNTIRDDRDNGVLTVTEVMTRSSNVGVTKMILSLPADNLVSLLKRVGFGQSTHSGFPGESTGMLMQHDVWRPFMLATLGFGYGVSVTPLQLAHAYSVFAAGGILYPISFLPTRQKAKGRRVLSKEVSTQLLKMLEAVVGPRGTGRHAQIEGFRVAGKTGTSRVADAKGYASNRHIASFVGMAPVSQPRLVVAVVITEPRAISYYSSTVAAPLFAKVTAGALRILGLVPDNALVKGKSG